MAGERHSFGGTTTDWVFDANNDHIPVLTGNVVIQAFNAASGGTQYTNLTQDKAGTVPITTLRSADGTGGTEIGTIPVFYGPPDVTRMWLSADGGPRLAVVATDIGDQALATAVALVEHDNDRNAHLTGVFNLVDVKPLTTDEIAAIPDGWVPAWDATLKKFKMRPPPVPILTADPVAPVEGDFWYNTTDNQLRIRRGDTTESILTTGNGGGGGGGGPTKPGELLTLKRWELTLPIGGDGGDPNNPLDIYAPALNTYEHPQYFQIVTDSAGVKCVEFTAPVKGPGIVTTSGESGAARSELREMASDNGGSSGPKAAWSMTDNAVHELVVTMTVDPTAIVNGRKELIIGQIHAAGGTPPVYLAVDFNTLPGKVQVFKAGASSTVILSNITTTTRFTYMIRNTAGGSSSRMQVSAALGNKSALPATPQYDWPVSDFAEKTGCYSKVGCYNKTPIDDSDASGFGKTRVYAMSLDGVGYVVPSA